MRSAARSASRSVAILALAILASASPAARAEERGQDALRRDMEFAREQVYPALVNISVVARQHQGGRSVRFPAAGSGVIVSPAGHVVTNYHVAGEATRIACRLPSKEVIEADVVAHDPLTDLSVLKLRLAARTERNRPIPFARLGDSDELTTGDYVLAMGNPLTLSSSMTLGIVSNPRRVFASFTGAELEELDLGEGQLTGLFTQWIQHDALILPGNSGGPLVNLKGEVVGINELGGAGVGFAIPSNLVSWVLNQALSYGTVKRGWLGLELAHTEKLGDLDGAIVAFVQPSGPAEQAGLRPGDRLLHVAGVPTNARHIEEIPALYARFAQLAPGARVPIAWERDGEAHTGTLEVGLMEKYLADEQEDRELGLTVRDITGPMALLRRYPDDEGILVTGVRPGYPAETTRPRLQEGDVVRELAGQPVTDYAAWQAIRKGLGKGGDVPVRVRRKGEDVVTVLDLGKDEPRRGGGELPKPWLGIRTQVLTPDVAKSLGHEGLRGFRVTQVYPGTEAEKAGLRIGDLVRSLADKALRAYRPQDAEMLQRRIERLVIGQEVDLGLLRGEQELVVRVKLEETPRSAAEVKSAEDELLEFKVRDLTFKDRVDQQWPRDQRGVLVTQVTSGSWAQLAGLRTRDLLLKVGDHEIEDVAAFRRAVAERAETRPSPIVFFVRRGYRTKFLFVEPDYPESR